MNFDAALLSFMKFHTQYGALLEGGLLIFCRILAFMFVGPIFNRKDIPMQVKVPMAMFFTVALMWVVPVEGGGAYSQGKPGIFILQILMNITIGLVIGFTADMIMRTITSAGSMMNNQIGLSSAVIFEPSSRQQVMVLDPLFGYLGLHIFIHLGGMYWLILALKRSFTVLPLHVINQPLAQVIDMDYLVHLSANVISVAVQLVSPVIVVTMAVDIILGIVNRTAQQMPVFQLSFALKPSIGAAVLLATLPILLNTIANFFSDYARIF